MHLHFHLGAAPDATSDPTPNPHPILHELIALAVQWLPFILSLFGKTVPTPTPPAA